MFPVLAAAANTGDTTASAAGYWHWRNYQKTGNVHEAFFVETEAFSLKPEAKTKTTKFMSKTEARSSH